jgi:hypothetical protein
MNIFSVLSTGKSNLHEPSMSAMLAYLLNPNQDHGLGRKFINSFLTLASQNNNIYNGYINDESIKFEIELEVAYRNKKKRNDIDIQIKILDKSYQELHRIIIENKIKSGAANPSQLSDYYSAVLNDKENDDVFELDENSLSVIFLTPKVKNKVLDDEFNNLNIENKVWLYWNSENTDITTIVNLIQNILSLEQIAKISPINEYMRHTLKAFTHFIIKTIQISTGKNRVGEDIGEVKLKENILINNDNYLLILRDSGQIQLLNSDGDKVQARPLLRAFLAENNISEKDNCQNTRCFGKQIFEYLDNLK